MNISDVFSLAFRTVRGNKLRTGITVAIIAFGIMALIGIITAIQAMNQKLTESFSTMGATGFTLRYKQRNIHFGNDNSDLKVSKRTNRKEKKSNLGKPINIDEADQLQAIFNPFVEPVFLTTKIPGAIGVFGSAVLSDPVLFVYPRDNP